ncbi:unnamed protein product [Clonostachys byssicola]|uniref:Uncharacterized protein n=1 Tax=Clonostachys byssicola TaxID=160290 RepID=A0A9N9UBD5_9HYPO|nr:unnamed protein product [Clonostachys byssicola]
MGIVFRHDSTPGGLETALVIQGRELEKHKVRMRGDLWCLQAWMLSSSIYMARKRAKLILLLPKHQVREASGMAGEGAVSFVHNRTGAGLYRDKQLHSGETIRTLLCGLRSNAFTPAALVAIAPPTALQW